MDFNFVGHIITLEAYLNFRRETIVIKNSYTIFPLILQILYTFNLALSDI